MNRKVAYSIALLVVAMSLAPALGTRVAVASSVQPPDPRLPVSSSRPIVPNDTVGDRNWLGCAAGHTGLANGATGNNNGSGVAYLVWLVHDPNYDYDLTYYTTLTGHYNNESTWGTSFTPASNQSIDAVQIDYGSAAWHITNSYCS